jgi:hypothetical protein
MITHRIWLLAAAYRDRKITATAFLGFPLLVSDERNELLTDAED